jgi:general stress protein 26
MDNTSRQEIVAILGSANDMTIATIRPDGYPQATTVSYVNDGMNIYFGTAVDSQKARNIAVCDKISLTINLPYATWDEIRGVSMGRARGARCRCRRDGEDRPVDAGQVSPGR